MAEDAKALIELATRRFIEEVPALEPIKLVVGVELRGRGDVQHFRLQMPESRSPRASATDAHVRVDMRREFFNVMAREGKVPDWIEAFTYGQAKATGPEQFLKLIVKVVEAQQEREHTAKRESRPSSRPCGDGAAAPGAWAIVQRPRVSGRPSAAGPGTRASRAGTGTSR